MLLLLTLPLNKTNTFKSHLSTPNMIIRHSITSHCNETTAVRVRALSHHTR